MDASKNFAELSDEIFAEVSGIRRDETMNTRFETVSQNVHKESVRLKNNRQRGKNFRVTDLCNPMQAYYDIMNIVVKEPEELIRKFSYGNFAEMKARTILSKEEGFALSQGDVDGSKCGMKDVRGKIDFRIKKMIIEFKTSEYDIPDEETLFSRNPQDLEQLLLYILFTERSHSEHRLLYLIGRYPNAVARTFKVKIKDKDALIKYFGKRRDSLKKALDVKSPVGLGKCRYFTSLCKFNKNGICNCSSEIDMPTEKIKDSIFIKCVTGDIGDKFTGLPLMQNYEQSFNLWDIFSPRKWFLKNSNPFVYTEWDEDDREKYYLRGSIEREFVKQKLLIRQPLANDVPELRSGLFMQNNALQNESLGSKEEIYPFLVRVQDSTLLSGLNLNPFYKAQLGLACALNHNLTGYVFVFHKNSEVGVLFKVTFSKLGNIRERALNIVRSSIQSMKENKLNPDLPLCPDFMKTCYTNCLCRLKG